MTDQHTFAIAELQQKANDGNAQAQFDLALCYVNGTGIEKNEELAFDWLKKAAEQGWDDAEIRLAQSYAQGLGVEKSEVNAFKWYAKAASKGDLESQALINECFNNEVVIKKNYKPYFGKNDEEVRQNSIDDKYWLSQEFLNLSHQEKVALLAYNWVYKSAQQGSAESQFRLAEYYFNTQSHFLSGIIYWYEMAAVNGHAQAKSFLTGVYLLEMGKLMSESNSDNDKAIYEYARKAVELGLAETQYWFLASFYLHEISKLITASNSDDDKAIYKYLRKAAELGLPEAQYLFGLMFWNSDYAEQSDQSAFEWFKKSAEQNFAEAQYRLACCYQDGVGVNQNDGLAFEWFKKAAEQGLSKAYSHLGIMYDEGRGVESNDELAFKYFQLAAEETDDGKGTSNFYLARCYEYGIGVEKNHDLAEKYKQKVDPIYVYKNALLVDPKSPKYKQHLPLKTDFLIQTGDFESLRKNFEEYSKRFEVADDYKHFYIGYIKKAEELNKKNQELEEKNKELNNLVAMFAHNFLGTLQCIRSNAEHENNPSIHLKTVKMMGGALTAFSILSADDDKLVEQLKQDNAGETSLQQSLANNLALAISQLLGKTNKDKIVNLYLRHLHKTQQIESNTTSEELRTNRDYRKKWQALQHQWEDEFNALFSEKADLPVLQQWITDNFFLIEIIGFDSCNISFKEHGITDSIFLIIFMEIFVNAFKYIDVSTNEPLTLTLCKEDQCYKLVCENPSSQETGRGTHKGMDFLKTIAKKLNGHFIPESTKSSFKATFSILSELLK